MKESLFALGRCGITPGARDALQSAGCNPQDLLARHQAGDWEEMDKHDKAANQEAVKRGFRVFSAYALPGTEKHRVYVITEADRSCTTILLPEEY